MERWRTLFIQSFFFLGYPIWKRATLATCFVQITILTTTMHIKYFMFCQLHPQPHYHLSWMYTCAPFLKSFFSISGNMCSEYLPFPCGPGSWKLKEKNTTKLKRGWGRECINNRQGILIIGRYTKRVHIPVNKADICMHQIVVYILKTV